MQPVNRQIILLLAIMANTSLWVRAQNYVGTVLYPLALPPGYSSLVVNSANAAQVSGYGIGGGYRHALLWSAPSGTVSVLDPSGFADADVNASDGAQQVGYGYGPVTESDVALLWSGTAASVIDLNPTSLFTNVNEDEPVASFAEGISANQQVGYGGYYDGLNLHYHALLWSGSAVSAVDLNPNFTGILGSKAYGTDGAQQVGLGIYKIGNVSSVHALLWSGTAASAVDLNPTTQGFFYSQALSVNGGQEVGYGESNNFHALLWTGTAASAVDLGPTNMPGLISSYALSTNGIQQVGYGSWISGNRALLWSGTAASAIDLQSLLPGDGSWTNSYAETIDSVGNVYGYASGTFDNVTGTFAVEWPAIPEPPGLSVVFLLALTRTRCKTGKSPVAPVATGFF